MANDIVDKYGNPTQNNVDEIADLNKRIIAVENTQKNTIKTYKRVIGFLIAIGVISTGTLIYVYNNLVNAKNLITETQAIMKSVAEERKNLSQEIVKYKNEIDESKNDFYKFSIEIEHAVGKAKLDAEAALAKAGLLVDAVNSAQSSATRAEEANLATQKTVFELEKISDNMNLLYKDIIASQKSFEALVAKGNILKQPKLFTVKITGDSGTYTAYSGKGIAYDRQFTGNYSSNYIIVPEGTNLIIEDNGRYNSIQIKENIFDKVTVKGSRYSGSTKIIK